MEKSLHLKHWQIFVLMIGIPFVLEIVGMATVFVTTKFDVFLYIISLVIILSGGIFFGWFWILGTSLHAKLPETVKMNLNTFKIFLLIPAIYIGLFSIIGILYNGADPEGAKGVFELLPVILPLHFFSIFCIFYCLYFISKELKAVEWQRPVTFGDYAGEFFLIWFFPIGVWFIQPKVNKMFGQQADTQIN